MAHTTQRRPPRAQAVLLGLLLLLLLLLCCCSTAAFVALRPCPSRPSVMRAASAAAAATGASSSKGKGGGGASPAKKAKPTAKAAPKGGAAASKGKGGGKPKTKTALGSAYAWALSETKALPAFDTLAPPLPADQLLAFERKGHTITRGLCRREEMADWGKCVRAAFEKDKLLALRQKVRVFLGTEAYEHARTVEDCEEMLEAEVDPEDIPFLQTFNSWRRYQDLRRLALAPRFAHMAAQLLGVPRVRLYQDSTFLKRDGDGPTNWHSDLAMAPFNTNDFITVWMPMTEVPPEEEGGTGLCFASGSGRDFALSFWDDPHASEDLSDRYEVESYGRMLPGDASWHHGWCLHSSAENLTGQDRLAFALAFVAADAHVLGKHAKNKPHTEDDLSYADWLGDCQPGERLQDHPFLPLVWDEGKKK